MQIRRTAAALTSAAALSITGVAMVTPAQAAVQNQDGLVNVAIGDITIQDVNVGVAATIAAQICGVQVGPVVLLAQRVDATSTQRTVCESDQGPVTLTQN